MIIDAHTHILPAVFRTEKDRFLRTDSTFATLFGYGRAKSATAEDLVASMDSAGVSASVAAGYGWTDPGVARLANDYAIESARRFPGRIVPLCSVNPLWGEEAALEVRRCAEAGARGVGELHPDTQGFSRADHGELQLLAPVMDAARAHGLPVLVHASEPVGHVYPGKGSFTPERALALAQAYAENTFIFAHFGGGLPFYVQMPEVAEQLGRVYFDSAAQPLLYRASAYVAAVAAAGADRVIFASDYPLIAQLRALRAARSAGLTPPVEAAVMADNAARLFRITVPQAGRRP